MSGCTVLTLLSIPFLLIQRPFPYNASHLFTVIGYFRAFVMALTGGNNMAYEYEFHKMQLTGLLHENNLVWRLGLDLHASITFESIHNMPLSIW